MAFEVQPKAIATLINSQGIHLNIKRQIMLVYRKDLDGLRALAVIAVFIYHAKLSFFGTTLLPGGFLGVDIFFVLSGYLITGILADSFDSGKFTWKGFYWRRFKRIVPTLLVVLVLVTFLFQALLMPSELENYFDSFISALFFLSNFHFLMEDSYSAEVSMYKPLLHTWTLAVEWQYYLLFPILFSIFAKFGREIRFYGLALTTLASFISANIMSTSNPDVSFYLLPYRFWELSLGGLLAIIDKDRVRAVLKARNEKFADNLISVLGLSFIFLSFIIFDDSITHPSYRTLLPVLGTCFLIFSGTKESICTNLISKRMFVYTGLISYSLYLWHQPILVFYRVTKSEQLSSASFILVFVASYLLSILTYHGIEKVFKRNGKRHFVLLVLFVLAVGNYYLFANKRISDAVGDYSYSDNLRENIEFSIDGRRCHGRYVKDACSVDFETRGNKIILLGDSHAGVLGKAFHELAVKNKYNFRNYTIPGCKGVIVRGKKGKWNDVCRESVSHIKQIVLNDIDQKLTIIYSIAQYRNVEGEFKSVIPPKLNSAFIKAFEDILAQGHRLILVYPIPGFNFDVPKEIKRRELNGLPLIVKTPISVHKKHAAQAIERFDAIQGDNVLRVYPEDIFCDATECVGNDRENIFYYDDNHLSSHGSRLLVDEIERYL